MNTLVVCAKCEKVSRVQIDRAEQARPICGNCKTELPYHHGVQSVSGTGLTKLLRTSDRPVVVDFWAEWCGPCKMFAPTFQAAAQEMGGKFIFVKLDTEASPDAAQAFGIRGIPTLIVFKNGQELTRQSGAMPLPMFRNFLQTRSS
jgi:thioredoxin 2